MKVKSNTHKNYSKGLAEFFKRNRLLKFSLIVFTGLLLFGIFFFSVLGYGAYLKKIEQSTYYKNVLLQAADLDFSFLKNYAQGHITPLDDIKVDLKFKHLMRIKYLRELALEEGYITKAMKDEDFPATLTFNGEPFDVKIGLTGLTTDHVVNPDKWSFQVKVKGEKTIKGVKRFGLLIPKARGYLTDWLGFELLKERGLTGLRVGFANVSINGKDGGIFYMEERFDKHLLESNQLREGVIFKIEEQLSAYQESKLMAVPETRAQLLLLKRNWQEVMAGDRKPGDFFDLEKLGKLFVITDLMNNKHPLYPGNLRFYFNPVTGLAEPIAREFGSLQNYELDKMAMWLEKPKAINDRHRRLREDHILKIIYGDLQFQKYYIQEANHICEKSFLDEFLAQRADIIHELTKQVYRSWPFYNFPSQKLYENQSYIRNVIRPQINEITAYFEQLQNNELQVHLRNQQYLPLEVTHLSWRDTFFFYSPQPVVLASKEDRIQEAVQSFGFQIPVGISWADSLLPELKVHYNFLGLSPGEKTAMVFPWAFDQRFDYSPKHLDQQGNYQAFDFIVEDGKNLSIPSGKWVIDSDLVIPRNKKLLFEANAQIDLINGAKLLSYSPILSNGTEEHPVVIQSSDASGKGVLVIRAKENSSLTHTHFDKISRPDAEGWSIPGALTFYESPVNIESCIFSNNQIGDDFLNIVRTDFTITNAVFKNIKADAFDCDFCTGTVSNSSFINIGNDGIDVSGTDIQIRQVMMDGVGDKGLSAGENSYMRANQISIKNAEIAITSKDQSRIEVEDAQISDSKIGITLFQKKPEFGPGYITGKRINIKNAQISYLVEEYSDLTIDGKTIPTNKENVKEILYGAEFGKSSR